MHFFHICAWVHNLLSDTKRTDNLFVLTDQFNLYSDETTPVNYSKTSDDGYLNFGFYLEVYEYKGLNFNCRQHLRYVVSKGF